MNNEANIKTNSYSSEDSIKKENKADQIKKPTSSINLNNPASTSLLNIREFFLNYSILYIFLKIIIGATFLILPLFLFRIILTQIHNTTEDETSYYINAFLPMILAVGTIMLYFFGFIVLKLFSICCGSSLIPTWEVRNMGNVLFYLLTATGIFMLIFNLKNCLIYLNPFSTELRNEAYSQDIMNAILARVFWYNVFEEDFNISAPARKFNLNDDNCDNNLMKNSNCLRINLHLNRVDSISDPILNKVPDNYMMECWTTLYGSIIFICVFSIIRVLFFKVKNSILYLIVISSTLYFYLILKINIKMNDQLKNLHKICPVYLILITLFIWRIIDLSNFLKRYSEENKIIIKDEDAEDLNFSVRQETYNWFEKSIIVLFDLIVIMSYILFIIVFSLSIAYIFDINDDQKNSSLTERKNKVLRSLCLISFLMFMAGNTYKLGDLMISPLFYSTEKKFFSAPIKRFYYKLLFNNNKPANLLEIKKMYSKNEKLDSHFTQDIANRKTTDLERNEENSSLIKDKYKY